MMKTTFDLFPLLEAMTEKGNPNSVSDAGVGAICALAAIEGGWLNVMINIGGLKNKDQAGIYKAEASEILEKARQWKEKIFDLVVSKMR